METIKINEPEGKAPVYCHYDGQIQPQKAFISLDICTGEVAADYRSDVGGGMSMREWNGKLRTYSIPCETAGSVLRAFMDSDEFKKLCGRILAGSDEVWDGNNYVGKLNNDAIAAEDDLNRLIENELVATLGDTPVYATPNDYLGNACHFTALRDKFLMDGGQIIDQSTTNAEIEKIADDVMANEDIDGVFLFSREDVIEWITSNQDELDDAAA